MKPCNHADAVNGCRVCELYATRADYRRLWDGHRPVNAIPRLPLPVVPCTFRGDELTGDELDQFGIKRDSKRHYHCEHEAKPLGAIICSCRGCGPGCKGYSSPSSPDA